MDLERQLGEYGKAVERSALAAPPRPASRPARSSPSRARVLAAIGVFVAFIGTGVIVRLQDAPPTQTITPADRAGLGATPSLRWAEAPSDAEEAPSGRLPPVAVAQESAYVVDAGVWRYTEQQGFRRESSQLPEGMSLPTSVSWTGKSLLVTGYSETSEPLLAEWTSQGWRSLPPPPASVVLDHQTVWTGDRLLVWSSEASSGQLAAAVFDYRTQTWSETPPAPIRSRERAVATWTGSQLLIWGGCAPRYRQCDDHLGDGTDLTDGAAYDVAANSWRRVPASPLTSGLQAVGSWTNLGLAIFIGDGSGGKSQAAIYSADTDQWIGLDAPPIGPRRYAATAVTDGRWNVFGGSAGLALNDGAVLDLQTLQWTPTPAAPQARERHSMFALGSTVMVVGGLDAGARSADGAPMRLSEG